MRLNSVFLLLFQHETDYVCAHVRVCVCVCALYENGSFIRSLGPFHGYLTKRPKIDRIAKTAHTNRRETRRSPFTHAHRQTSEHKNSALLTTEDNTIFLTITLHFWIIKRNRRMNVHCRPFVCAHHFHKKITSYYDLEWTVKTALCLGEPFSTSLKKISIRNQPVVKSTDIPCFNALNLI